MAEVLQVCLDFSPTLGGLTRGIRDMAAVLGGRIVSLDSGRYLPMGSDEGAHVTRLPTGSGPLLSRHLRISRGVLESLSESIAQADLVICHSLYRAHIPAIRRLCAARSTPYWIVTHGMLDPWVVNQRWLAKQWWLHGPGRACIQDATRIVFSTPGERHKALRFVQGANTAVVPWPVALPDLADKEEARLKVRRQLGIGLEERLLLWLGRYDQLKRPHEVVRSFVSSAPPGWRLIMAGYEGDLSRDSISTDAHRIGRGLVTVIGAVEGQLKADLLLAADAFISLSWRENFGYAPAEAMAFGLPTFVTPDHDLLSDAAETPFVTRAAGHTRQAIVVALQAFLRQDSATMAAAGAAGRGWISNTCNPDAFATRLQALAVMR